VPRDEIDDLYIDRPYYIVPDGKVGQQAFAVIRDAIKKRGMVALGRVVLSTREHVVALEPRDRGIVGLLLHYPCEVREPQSYFDDIPKENTPKEMLDLASHIIETMTGHFQPKKFEDRYENALRHMIKRKEAGEKITPAKVEKPKTTTNLMDALRLRQRESGYREKLFVPPHIAPDRVARGDEGPVEPFRQSDHEPAPERCPVARRAVPWLPDHVVLNVAPTQRIVLEDAASADALSRATRPSGRRQSIHEERLPDQGVDAPISIRHLGHAEIDGSGHQ
jgi:hypothetical protein